MARVNGWYRLWIVATLLVGVWFGWLVFLHEAPNNGPVDTDFIRTLLLFWVLAAFGLLLIGHAVAWTIRGFRTESK